MRRLLVLALASFLPGCDGCTGESAPSSARVKDTFVYVTSPEPNNLDPVTQDGNSNVWPLMNVYQTLVRLDVAGTGFEPDLAESWTASGDGLTWTFKLRRDARFSSGTRVTSRDVLFSLERSRKIEGPWRSFMADVAGIAARDDHTVVITLKQRSAPFLANISLFSNAILSADFFKDAPPATFSGQMMGSGPYMMAEWKKGEHLVLRANPYYHEQGLPKTREVKLLYIEDENTSIIKLQTGEVDGVDNAPFARLAELRASPSLQVQLNPCISISSVVLNNRSGPLANRDFRKALAYATDREGLVKALLFGNGTPATSFLTPTSFYFDKELKGHVYDLDRAREHLVRSGVPAGTKLEIVTTSASVRYATALALKDMWGRLGVDVQVDVQEVATLNARTKAADFQIRLGGWNDDIPDPSELSSYELRYPQTGYSNSGYRSDKMNALIDDGAHELDPARRARIYKDIQALAVEDSPNIWLYYRPYPVALRKHVEGFAQSTMGPWIFKSIVVRQ